MILEHRNAVPYTIQQTQEVAAVWKLKDNSTYGADLAHWTIIFGPVTQHLQVTNSTARII